MRGAEPEGEKTKQRCDREAERSSQHWTRRRLKARGWVFPHLLLPVTGQDLLDQGTEGVKGALQGREETERLPTYWKGISVALTVLSLQRPAAYA